MIAHLLLHKGEYAWSGHNASGDPRHEPHALVVDVGYDFHITDEGRLYLTSPGRMQFEEFTAFAFVLSARLGYFGFKVIGESAASAAARDRAEQARLKTDRRHRSPKGA